VQIEKELIFRDYTCVGVLKIFLILQQLGKNSINEKFHSRFSGANKEEKNRERIYAFRFHRVRQKTKLIVLCKGENRRHP
jgi:hypothetical protein